MRDPSRPDVARLLKSIQAAWTVEPDSQNEEWGSAGWGAVLRLAEREGLSALLYRGLHARKTWTSAPDWVQETLRGRYYNAALRASRAIDELSSVVQCLQRAGIDCLALKGPALSHQSLGDWTLREFGDLDILVTDVEAARAALLDQGYDETEPSPSASLHGFSRAINLEPPPGREFPLDVHETISEAGVLRIAVSNDGVFRRACTVELQGRRVPTLSVEDAFVYLCIHGARHRWQHPRLAVDLALLASSRNGPDWAVVEKLVAEAGDTAQRAVELSCSLLNRLFDSPAASSPWRSRKPRSAIERLSKALAQSLLSGATPTPFLGDRVLVEVGGVNQAFGGYMAASLRERVLRTTQRDEVWARKLGLPVKWAPLLRPVRLPIEYGPRRMAADCAGLALDLFGRIAGLGRAQSAGLDKTPSTMGRRLGDT